MSLRHHSVRVSSDPLKHQTRRTSLQSTHWYLCASTKRLHQHLRGAPETLWECGLCQEPLPVVRVDHDGAHMFCLVIAVGTQNNKEALTLKYT